eukprot:COSAG06_NODE_2631_length_6549_cov_4.290078_4_plen_199_part_00
MYRHWLGRPARTAIHFNHFTSYRRCCWYVCLLCASRYAPMAVTPPPWPKTTAKPSLGMTTWLHPPVHINIPTSAQSQSVIGQSHKPECHAMFTLISSLSQACLGNSAFSHECSCLIVLSCVAQGGVPGPPRPSCTTCSTPTVMFPDAASIAVRLPLPPPHQMLPPPSYRNNISVLNISYLCPEPVLANTRLCVCLKRG